MSLPPGYGLRPARRTDSRCIAGLYRLSSEGVSDYVWSRLAAPGEDLLDVGERRYAREGTPFSYQSTCLVEHAGAVVAMLVAFPMHVAPGARGDDPVLRPYAELEEDASYYVCGVAVEAAHRGRGLGRALMARAEADARAAGLAKTSLIVFEANAPALALYRSLGYAERMRRAIVPHPLIHPRGDALLMVKQLSPATV